MAAGRRPAQDGASDPARRGANAAVHGPAAVAGSGASTMEFSWGVRGRLASLRQPSTMIGT